MFLFVLLIKKLFSGHALTLSERNEYLVSLKKAIEMKDNEAINNCITKINESDKYIIKNIYFSIDKEMSNFKPIKLENSSNENSFFIPYNQATFVIKFYNEETISGISVPNLSPDVKFEVRRSMKGKPINFDKERIQVNTLYISFKKSGKPGFVIEDIDFM